MFSRVIPIRRLLYGSLAPVGGGARPVRLDASERSVPPAAGGLPERRASASLGDPSAQGAVSSPVGSRMTPVR